MRRLIVLRSKAIHANVVKDLRRPNIRSYSRVLSELRRADSVGGISGVAGTRMKLALTELARIDVASLVLVERIEQFPEPICFEQLSVITRSWSMWCDPRT